MGQDGVKKGKNVIKPRILARDCNPKIPNKMAVLSYAFNVCTRKCVPERRL